MIFWIKVRIKPRVRKFLRSFRIRSCPPFPRLGNMLMRLPSSISLRQSIRYLSLKQRKFPAGNLLGIPGSVAEVFERNHARRKILLWTRTLWSNAYRHFFPTQVGKMGHFYKTRGKSKPENFRLNDFRVSRLCITNSLQNSGQVH